MCELPICKRTTQSTIGASLRRLVGVISPDYATLPFASVWLCRDPVGGQVFFWVAPWTCAFWSILAHNLIGSKFWRGREAVEEWRARRGGYVRSVAKGTAWMFASLFFSYGCEFGVLWETHSAGWMPAAAYFPVAFTVVWCSRG